MAVILQVNFTYDVPEAEATAATDEEARYIAERPGLAWKVWIRDPDTKTSGGIYLFADRSAAEAWRRELQPRIEERKGVSNFQARIFEITEKPTRITRGPVDVSVTTAQI